MREFHLSFMRKNYRKEEDAIRAYERTIEKPDNNLATVLHYLDENFDLGMLYYPGSGFHIKPRDTLGENRVTHLSLQPEHYFKHLGEGIKVVGDYRNTSFPDNSFDMVYTVHVIEQVPSLYLKIVKELVRVSSNIIILIEPSYEFGSNSSKKNIFKKGYTQIRDSDFNRLDYKLIYRDIMELRSYINGSEIVILKKNKNKSKKNKNKTKFICPITHESLVKKGKYLSNKSKTINYQIKNSISKLCPEDRI